MNMEFDLLFIFSFFIVQKKRRRRRLWSNGLVHRKKSAQSHAKDLNGAESDEGDDDDEDEDEGNTSERVEAEEVVNESEQMDVENMENGPTTTENMKEIQEAVHSHNGHISSTEADCTDSSVDGIQKSSAGILDRESGNNGEVQAVEHTKWQEGGT